MGENDERISLLDRLLQHAHATATYNIRRRPAFSVAHEAIFNINDGNFRCPNSQQGYSPFTTWTRGLAWAMCGFAEQLEFLAAIGETRHRALFEKTARATCDFYIANTPTDGIPYWDTGAPRLHKLGDYLDRPGRPIQRLRAGGQFGGDHRCARVAAARPVFE